MARGLPSAGAHLPLAGPTPKAWPALSPGYHLGARVFDAGRTGCTAGMQHPARWRVTMLTSAGSQHAFNSGTAGQHWLIDFLGKSCSRSTSLSTPPPLCLHQLGHATQIHHDCSKPVCTLAAVGGPPPWCAVALLARRPSRSRAWFAVWPPRATRTACKAGMLPRGSPGPSHRRARMHDGTAAPSKSPPARHGTTAAQHAAPLQQRVQATHNGEGPLPASSVASCVAAARPLRPAGGWLTATCGGAGRRGHLLRATQLCAPPHRRRAGRRACWRSDLHKS